ncbi:hypothetical protein PAMP_012362 [Pampus punctatissimus]
MIGGNAEAGSVYRAKRHTFPLQPDLVRETGSSWWQARLGAPLCPQPRLPASLALQARLLGLRVVKEEISDDNAKLPCFNGRVVSWVSEMDNAPMLPLSPSCTASALSKDTWSTHGSCNCSHVTPPQSF